MQIRKGASLRTQDDERHNSKVASLDVIHTKGLKAADAGERGEHVENPPELASLGDLAEMSVTVASNSRCI